MTQNYTIVSGKVLSLTGDEIGRLEEDGTITWFLQVNTPSSSDRPAPVTAARSLTGGFELIGPDGTAIIAGGSSTRDFDAYARCIQYIGDSEIFGFGPGSTTDLVGLTTIEPGYVAKNNGVGGETSYNMKIRFDALLTATPALKKQTWVFWTGRNNAGQGTTIVQNLQDCIAQLGHSRYLVLTVTPRDDETIGTSPRISLIATNNLIKSAFGDHVVDLDPVVCTAAGSMVPLSYRPDGDILHFNALGYSVIYPAVYAKLAALPSGYEVTSPDSIAFTSVTGASAGVIQTSATIKLQGMNAVSPISIVNGEYQINGGAWTSSPGAVLNGATLAVRHTASAAASTKVTTTVFVGSSRAKFSSTTAAVSNLIANGTFDSDATGWVLGANVAVSNGTLNWTAANYANAAYAIENMVAGASYRLTYTITARTAGSITPKIIGTTQVSGVIRSAAGTFVETIVAPAAPTKLQFSGASTSDTLSIDNVTLVQL